MRFAIAFMLIAVALIWAGFWWLGRDIAGIDSGHYDNSFLAVAALALLPLGGAIYLLVR